jgi:hypothetical protein
MHLLMAKHCEKEGEREDQMMQLEATVQVSENPNVDALIAMHVLQRTKNGTLAELMVEIRSRSRTRNAYDLANPIPDRNRHALVITGNQSSSS